MRTIIWEKSILLLKQCGLMVMFCCLTLQQGIAHAEENTSAKPQSAKPFEGAWDFSEHTGWERGAQVELTQHGTSVEGKWSFGSKARAWQGDLKGTVRGDKLFVMRCYEEGVGWGDEKPICPTYDNEESFYFIRQGKNLVWYVKEHGQYKQAYVLEPYVIPTEFPGK